MSLVVVLINWQNEEQTLQCVRLLRCWKTLDPEIIVVDNQSTKDSAERLRHELAEDELICSTINLGYAGGNNVALKKALQKNKDFILLLNTDAEISKSSVEHLLKRLRSRSDISILGPVIFEKTKSEVQCLIGGRDIAKYSFTRIAVDPKKLRDVKGHPLHEVDYVSGTVFLVRRVLFEEIGLLDELYFFSGEIADFCKRARDTKHKICTDLEVKATHYLDKSHTELRDSLYIYYSLRNRFLYIIKYYRSQKFGYFSIWLTRGCRQFAGALMRGETTKARAVFLALKHALAYRFGNQNDKFI